MTFNNSNRFITDLSKATVYGRKHKGFSKFKLFHNFAKDKYNLFHMCL